MMYEIKVNVRWKDGREVKESNLSNTVEFAKRNGLDAIKFIKEGKTKFTWIELPNEYQMKTCYDTFEVVITEVTTGKQIYTFK